MKAEELLLEIERLIERYIGSDIQSILNKEYEYTGNQNDIIKTNDMVRTILCKTELSTRQIELQLNKITQSKIRRIDNKVCRVKLGYKLKVTAV